MKHTYLLVTGYPQCASSLVDSLVCRTKTRSGFKDSVLAVLTRNRDTGSPVSFFLTATSFELSSKNAASSAVDGKEFRKFRWCDFGERLDSARIRMMKLAQEVGTLPKTCTVSQREYYNEEIEVGQWNL